MTLRETFESGIVAFVLLTGLYLMVFAAERLGA
jgi:hypothetical protein